MGGYTPIYEFDRKNLQGKDKRAAHRTFIDLSSQINKIKQRSHPQPRSHWQTRNYDINELKKLHKKRFKAFKYNHKNGKLTKVLIAPRRNQDFNKHRTKFEIRHIDQFQSRRQTVIVDETFEVIAYKLLIGMDEIMVSNQVVDIEKNLPLMSLPHWNVLVDYFIYTKFHGTQSGYISHPSPGARWVGLEVIFNAHGDIIAFVGSRNSNNGTAISVDAIGIITDVITGAVLFKAALKFVVRAGVKTLVRAATSPVVKRVGKKVSRLFVSASKAAQRAGIPPEHLAVLTRVARGKAGEAGRHILVRFGNLKSVKWIKLKYPAKPLEIKAKTSEITGLVTAKTKEEVDGAIKAGYYVVDDVKDGVAVLRGGKGNYPMLKNNELPDGWKLEKGQVIHPTQHKPLTADIDVMAAFTPDSKGRNITLAVVDDVPVKNRTNPLTSQVRNEVNSGIGDIRVMHGGHDSFGDLKSVFGKPGDGVLVVNPDGSYELLESLDELKEFYRLARRKDITDSYNPAGILNQNPDIGPRK